MSKNEGKNLRVSKVFVDNGLPKFIDNFEKEFGMKPTKFDATEVLGKAMAENLLIPSDLIRLNEEIRKRKKRGKLIYDIF